LILGKGKSLSKVNEISRDELKKFNVMSINEAYQAINDYDVSYLKAVIFNDIETLGKLLDDPPEYGVKLLTTANFYNPNKPELLTTDFWVKIMPQFKDHDFYYYSPGFNWLKSVDPYPVIAYNSTFESALWILGYAGVREIYTCGIDHNVGYDPKFGENQTNYAAVKYYSQVPIDFFGLQIKAL
jgi:hypothetical protein